MIIRFITEWQMAFERIDGFKGKLFIPDVQKNSEKKHPCKDCFSCQHCEDERCELCLKKCNHLEKKNNK